MSHNHAVIASVALSQLGLITRSQLRELGVPDSTTSRWVAEGRMTTVDRGVFLMAGAPLTWHVRVLAACRARGGIASHLTAAAIHNCPSIPRTRPEVLVPYGAHGRAGRGVHRSRRYAELPTTTIDRIPVVAAGPLSLQLAGLVPRRLPLDRFDDAVEHLVRSSATDWHDLARWVDRGSRSRLAGVGHLRSLVDEYLADDCESRLERAFRDLLVAHGVPLPVEQHEIVLPDGRVVRVDFAYPDIRYAMELDSKRHHLHDAGFENDKEKRNELGSLGWLVHEITRKAIRTRPDTLVAQVRRELDRRGRGERRIPA